MATIQELQRLINELESKIANLAPNNAGFVNLLNNLKQSASNSGQLQQNLDAARQLLGSVNKEIQEINDELGYTFKSFQAIVNELTKGKANIGNINKGVQSLTNIAQKLVNRQSEYGKLTATELKKQRDSAFITFENLRVEREILKDRLQNATLSAKQRTADTIRLRELNGILQANIGLENSLKRQLEYAYEEQQAIEDSLGITGNLLKAFATLPGLQSISKYLKIDDAVEEMENLSKRFIETVKKRPEIESQFTQLNSEMSRLVDGIARIDEVLETATDPAVIARFQANREQAAKKLNDQVYAELLTLIDNIN
jgi:chromosome segregation ATPase